MSNIVPNTLSQVEREHLNEMKRLPGWGVLIKVMDAYVEAYKEAATTQIESDPLCQEKETSRLWTQYVAARNFNLSIQQGVNRELDWLKVQTAAPADTAETPEQRKRRQMFEVTGMLEQPPHTQK